MKKYIILLIIYLCTLKFFQIRTLSNFTIYACLYSTLLYLICAYVINKRKLQISLHSEFGVKYLNFFLICCFVPCIGSLLFWNARISDLFFVVLPNLSLLIYYYLHSNRYSEKVIINVLSLLAFSRIIITIIQQYTYPNIWFGAPLYNNDELLFDIRSGIIRYYLSLAFWFNVLLSFYYFNHLIKKFSKKYLFYFLITIIGIYIDQSRTMMVLCCLIYFYIYIRNIHDMSKYSNKIIIVIAFLCIIYFNFLFNDLFEQTQEDLNEAYVRLLSYKIFLFDFWANPLAIIIGNGYPVPGAYTRTLEQFADFTVFREDVGIVGALNQYGIGLCIAIILYLWKIIKKRQHISDYLVAYALFSFGYLFLYSPVHYDVQSNAFWGTYMFLVDLSFKNNKYE